MSSEERCTVGKVAHCCIVCAMMSQHDSWGSTVMDLSGFEIQMLESYITGDCFLDVFGTGDWGMYSFLVFFFFFLVQRQKLLVDCFGVC